MIGVVANPPEYAVIREFFELFKTPWEFCRDGRRYDVLLCAGDAVIHESEADLTVIYAGRPVQFDVDEQIQCVPRESGAFILSARGTQIPIYGESVILRETRFGAADGNSESSVIHLSHPLAGRVTRVGYDLFHEIRILLTVGQPAVNAGIPTLELHIALLRDLIVSSGIPLAEIPPVPEGYRFIACLTHDVDHPSIGRHRFDRTMFGFLYRALAGSLLGVLQGRMPLRRLLKNWTAAFKLPFVYLGLAKDFWLDFGRYTRLEDGLPSSFFVIPFRDSPGHDRQGRAPGARAARYCADDISAEIHELLSAGCEIGLHGIDAWLDHASGRGELEQICRITGTEQIGVRMHWLYFDNRSPLELEKAGADYDSTSGYNETVGYRAGTTQAFKPLDAIWLLELPLHVMDTALFFPCHLNLSPGAAREQVVRIVEHAVRHGGCLTVNWHDRSIAPERLWDDFYVELVRELRSRGAWFATASQAVAWFRKRRVAVFKNAATESGIAIAARAADGLPALQLRIHGRQAHRTTAIAHTLQSTTRSVN